VAAVDRGVEDLLAEGRRLYAQQEYDGAIRAMQRALDAPDDAPRHRVEAYETMGCAYVALSDDLAARRAFRALLVIDPYYVLREPSGSPKIRDVFEGARRELVHDAAIDPDLEVRVTLPESVRAGGAVAVRAVASSPVARMSLRTRRRGTRGFDRVAMAGAGRSFQAVLPLPDTRRPYGLELYVEARDARGDLVARGGSPLDPRSLRVEGRTERPRGGGISPWLWVGAGAVVVGAVVAGIVLSTGGDDDEICGTLEPCRVELSLER
jgi:tetratricopeptide (TPR) repeat protein